MTEKLLISCASIQPELESVISRSGQSVESIYLDQDYHRHPERITGEIQRILQEDSRKRQVILGYGLCSNAVVGITAPAGGIIMPRIHDCIGLYLGSMDRYMALFHEYPGTYYLTPGWIERRRDPLGTMIQDYAERVGRDEAEAVMRQELRHYTRLVYIDTGARRNADTLKQTARENAEYFGMEYTEVPGDLSLLHTLVTGPYSEPEFVIVHAGDVIRQNMFF